MRRKIGLFNNLLRSNFVSISATQAGGSSSRPVMHLNQASPICKTISDHKGFTVTLGDGSVLYVENGMMQAKMRVDGGFNNGFELEEDDAAYCDRVKRKAHRDANLIRNNPKLFVIVRKEFMIQSEHVAIYLPIIRQIPGWEKAEPRTTSFGQTFIFKSDAVAAAFYRNEAIAAALATQKLDSRCQVFDASDSFAIGGAHVPVLNTEQAYEDIVYTIFKNKTADMPHQKSIIFPADTNLSPEKQAELNEKVFQRIVAERKAQGLLPISMTAYSVNSHNGHQRINEAGLPELSTVDSCQFWVIEPSDSYNFRHVPESEGRLFRFWMSVILGGSVVVSNVASDDVALTVAAIVADSNLAGTASASIASLWNRSGPALFTATRIPPDPELWCHFNPTAVAVERPPMITVR